jgi:putative endonuclease
MYIVRCADGTLYTGYACDATARAEVHNAGRGARYTAGRRPIALVYSELFDTKSEALKREYQVKRWNKARKEALVGSAIITR